MNVIKIVVDELPESCGKCTLSIETERTSMLACPFLESMWYSWEKPKECPLVVEDDEVCVWVLRNFDGRKMYNSPENCGYHATQPEFIYCPSCGKRIKYVEE